MASGSTSSRAQLERDHLQKKAKEQFLMFTRVLMKYLEQKDPQMHTRARHVIRECAEKSKKKEQGYESVTASMKTRLRATVGEQYWKRAEDYLTHFQQKMQERKAAAGSSSASSMPSLTSSKAPPQIQQQQQQQQQLKQQQASQQPSQGQAQAQSAAAMQAQLAERQLNERRARERVAEQERQKKELERTKAADEALRKQRQQAAEKMRQHQEAAAKMNQARETTKLQMQSLKAQTEQQRAAAGVAATEQQRAAAAAAAPSTAPKRQGEPSSSKRKASSTSSVTSTNSSTAVAAAVARATSVRPVAEVEAPPREYTEFLEMIDHAVDYDWTTAGLLLGNKADVDLNVEQRTLLYGNSVPKIAPDHKICRGWNDRNILSARAAWAKVRLPELEREIKESKSATPVVAGISLPREAADSAKVKTTWLNEERAETDTTLALLSEATEIYVKQVLEKALVCARQRENLDGIRLWHAQHSTSKPPLGLRVGCDVTRQVALAAGNAARIVQRMEEAFERNPAQKSDLSDPEVLADAASMGDLACRPKLATGAEKAAYQAKRSFEVSGGKDAGSPPFGRVPKQAKIMALDFERGMELTTQRPPRFTTFNFL